MTTYEGNDIYCDLIIPKKGEVNIIKETENVLAFHSTDPCWKTHVVVVPKKHVLSLIELAKEPGDLVKELLDVSAEVAESIKNSEGGCIISTAVGNDQHSSHFHVSLHHGPETAKAAVVEPAAEAPAAPAM